MRRVIREELQHIVSEELRHFDCFSRQFRKHRNFSCFDCSRNGHTQCYCTANTNSKRHYVSHGEGTDQPLVINESCYRNTIQGNSPVQNSVCYSQGKEMDSCVVLHNVVVEVDPQVFEVANVEERDVVFDDAQVDVCDVLDHDDVKITEFVVNDSIVAGSHLAKNVTPEVYK